MDIRQTEARGPDRPHFILRPDAFAPGLKQGRALSSGRFRAAEPPAGDAVIGADEAREVADRPPGIFVNRHAAAQQPDAVHAPGPAHRLAAARARLQTIATATAGVVQRRWAAFDAPAKGRLLASSARKTVQEAGRAMHQCVRGAKVAGSWLLADANGLKAKAATAFGQYRAWSRIKEEQVDQLAEQARYSVASRRFAALAPLNAEERRRLEDIDYAERMMHQAGTDLAIEGEGRSKPRMILSGWAARIRVVDGRRQVLAIYLPGDIVAMRPRGERRPSATITALSIVETVDAGRIVEMAGEPRRFPGVAEAVERAAAHEAVFADNQIWRLGGMDATRRVANLFSELHWRLTQTELATATVFPMPLTCETIADALSMRPQQVRSVLNKLRAKGLYSSRYCRVSVSDPMNANAFSTFSPPEAPEPEGRTSPVHLALVAAE